MTYIVCIVMPPHKDTPLRLEELTILPDFIGREKRVKQKREDKGIHFNLKNKKKKSGKKASNETEISNSADKELKAFVIRIPSELGKRIC